MGWKAIGSLWRLDSPAWLIAIAAFAIYLVAFGLRERRRTAAFAGALAIFLLATVSPVAVLADGYLFSAHVAQHLLLLLLLPPLLIASLPARPAALALQRRWIHLVQESLVSAPLSWVLGLGVMWLWHVPRLCSASVASTPVFVLQVVTLVLAGTAFYWPIMSPVREDRLSPPVSIIYLFLGCLGCTALGIVLTFAPISACPVYLHPRDPLGIGPLLQSRLGLSHESDQQLGGLLMWVPACMVYLTAILVITKRWLSEGSVNVPTRRGTRGIR